MGTYDNILPPSRLDKAVDKAVQEVNEDFLNNDLSIAKAQAEGDAWRRLMEAEGVVAEHGIVLPAALARDLLRALNGEDTMLSTDMLKKMLADHLDRAERRSQTI